ncbi:MAG: hypothetical protein ABW321_10450 [Polyangiales bacterium]
MERRPSGKLPTLLDADPGVVSVIGYENINIVVWRAQPTPEAVELVQRVAQRRRRQHPNGISAVHLVKGEITLPDAPTREAFVRLMKGADGSVHCVAVVVAGSGFWASSARSLITGMRVLARGGFDMGLHGDVDEVVKWLPAKHEARTGVHIDPGQLAAVLRSAEDA